MKTAVVHDWLVTYAGADRVLEQILACYPEADLFSLVDFLPADLRGFILHKPVRTSFLQALPFARRSFRKYFALMPLAVEQLDLSAYDLVISNSHSMAKGVLTGPDQLHICYCLTPMRYAWDLQNQYLKESALDKGPSGWLTKWLLHKMRLWDLRTANGVDEFIAISHFVSRRIRKVYRRKAQVIYPPVDIESFQLGREKADFYVTASRLVPYKRISVIVEAFNRMPDKKLVVIGDGANWLSTKAIANHNVTMLGFQGSDVLRQYLQRAQGFVFAAEEDFGICVAEAQACGTPVIAFGKGGALEIVRDLSAAEPTGLFFKEQTPQSIVEAVGLFERERKRFDPEACRRNVVRFSAERFCREFREFCESTMARSRARMPDRAERDLVFDGAAGA
ncbi:MAG TPA: glycosyltransferase family 4 protein [Terriglobales bacterium]|nr:glycosyltransferase family 4 protein [Terriglobales bacterium]